MPDASFGKSSLLRAWTRRSRSLHSLRSALRRVRSASQAKASRKKDRRDDGTDFLNHAARRHSGRRAPPAQGLYRQDRATREEWRFVRTFRKDEESNGDEHVHDFDVLPKGRRVIGGARGGREWTSYSESQCTSS